MQRDPATTERCADSPDAPAGTGRTTWRATLAVFAAALAVHGLLQAIAFPADRPYSEAWLHARWSQQYGSGAIDWRGGEIPWLPYTRLGITYPDWRWGWHWLAAAFTTRGADAIDGFRLFLAVQGAVVAAVLHHVLASGGVRRAWIWAALLPAVASVATWRLHLGHDTPAQVAGSLLAWHFLSSRRPVAGGIALAATLLAVFTPQVPVTAAACAVLGVAAAERRLPWREAAGVVCGVVAAVLLHPGAHAVAAPGVPGLGAFGSAWATWTALADSASFAAAGAELRFPDGFVSRVPSPADLLPLGTEREAGLAGLLSASSLRHHGALLAATLLAAGAAGMAVRRGRATARAVAAAAAAVAFAWMTSAQRGRIDAWGPFAVLALAEALAGPTSPPFAGMRLRAALGASAAALLASIGPMASFLSVRRLPPADEIAPAMAAVRERARPGDIVWSGDWGEFGNLVYEAPDLRFVDGIDPWFAADRNPDLVRSFIDVRLAATNLPGLEHALARRFAARFVVLWRRPLADGTRLADHDVQLLPVLRRAPWARVIHEDAAAVAFEID